MYVYTIINACIQNYRNSYTCMYVYKTLITRINVCLHKQKRLRKQLKCSKAKIIQNHPKRIMLQTKQMFKIMMTFGVYKF